MHALKCGLFILMLVLPTLFSLFAFASVLLLVHRMWTMERPRMKKAQAAAFMLYDQVTAPKKLNILIF